MKKMLKSLIPASLKRYAAEKKRMSSRAALRRISTRNIDISTVIDVGASDGRWSGQAMDYFPDADYLLIEANPYHRDALNEFCASNPSAYFEIAAASNKDGEVSFDGSDPFGGKAEPEDTSNSISTKSVRLDSFIVPEGKFNGPFLLKLDTHGYEVPILEGAEKILENASLVVIETYGFRIAPEALLFHEMVAYMREKGFGVVDISDPLWRPGDKSFWQIDLYFQPLTIPNFQNNTYA